KAVLSVLEPGPDDVHLQRTREECLVRVGGCGMGSAIAPLAIALLVPNGVTFAVFAYDKDCAIHGARRIPERTLYLLMALGGSPAGWLAMLSLHHKNRKAAVRSVAWLILLLQIALLAAVALTARPAQ